MQKLGQLCAQQGFDIECTAKGLEDYMSFSLKRKAKKIHNHKPEDTSDDDEVKWKIHFIDSMQFLTCSLEGLTDNLKQQGLDYFKAMSSYFYPYEYMDNVEKFEECTLPPKNMFYSSLTESEISNEDYQHAKHVWDRMDIKNL
ncbi:MAG: hypothetical protein ACRY3E_05760, partial [Candidatus Lariskella arthropodorum]